VPTVSNVVTAANVCWVVREDPELDTIVPDSPNKPYDMRDVIHRIVDDGEFFGFKALHGGQNIFVVAVHDSVFELCSGAAVKWMAVNSAPISNTNR